MRTLSHIDAWVFDLDNTLYPAESGIFSQINARMCGYIERELGLSLDEAKQLQKEYFYRYGAALRGLMIHHGSDPLDFLDYVHDIDFSSVSAAPSLARAVSRLPGRKFIFTNGVAPYADKLLELLGLREVFSGIFDIILADYRPKPDPQTYRQLLQQYDIEPSRSIFFEDIPRNLAPAADLGMTTVWVRNHIHAVGAQAEGQRIDHITDDLTAGLRPCSKSRPSVIISDPVSISDHRL